MSNNAQSLLPAVSGKDDDGSYLKGAVCETCGFIALGVRRHCPQCWAENSMKDKAIGRRGVLYTSTVIHSAAVGFEGPYAVGYVDVTEGLRIFAHLQMGEDAPKIGDPVELTSAPLRTDAGGRTLTGPRYCRANSLEATR